MPPLGVVEDLRGAFDFVLGVCVQSDLGAGVLVEESVLGGCGAPSPGCWLGSDLTAGVW